MYHKSEKSKGIIKRILRTPYTNDNQFREQLLYCSLSFTDKELVDAYLEGKNELAR